MMNSRITICFIAFLSSLLVHGGLANESCTINEGEMPDSFMFSWQGHPNRTYFILQSSDLITWEYLPVIEVGKNIEIQWGFLNTFDKVFLRLHYTDTFSANPWKDDFDNDGIDNYTELLLGLKPLDADSLLVIGYDDDSDGIINQEDAAPSDSNVGMLSVSIEAPLNQSTLN